MSQLKKRFYRLYYRRNAAKTIESLVFPGTSELVSKVGATFNTEGAADQLFVGMTIVAGGETCRVSVITDDENFEVVPDHVTGETVSGVFSTSVLADMLAYELMDELDDYWIEFAKVEIGSFLKIEKGDSIQTSIGDMNVISENASIEFNVLGFQEHTTTPELDGRFEELRTAINGKPVDILLFNDNLGDPYAVAYYNVVGSVVPNLQAGELPRIGISLTEMGNVFDENDLDIMLFTVETPVAVPGGMAGPQNVVVTCNTKDALMYYTTTGVDPTTGDTYIENGGIIPLLDDCTLKVKAFKDGMTASAVLEEVYT